MGKKLIITEKPSVARDFARVLGVSGNRNGYIENDTYVISWCFGHLVEMLYPEDYDSKYENWNLEDLPFLPKEYKYGVIEKSKDQYNIVHELLHREDIDTVYWAGDSGKEGQTIEENIRMYGGVREGMTELRVWIDSQTDDEIRRGIREAKPMSDYNRLGRSGIMRTIEDYSLGINFSRALSVKYGRMINSAAATEKYTAIAIGRVMTCVLGMVVNREREIRNFTETPFYRVVGSFSDVCFDGEWKTTDKSKYNNSPLLYKENGFKKKESAEKLIEELSGNEAYVQSVECGTSKKKAPLLFNLAELQSECSKIFKISPSQTLQVIQDLYESKLTTYPRTDARVLTKAVAKEIYRNISPFQKYEPVKEYASYIMDNKKFIGLEKTMYVDDSKVTDHYAIIPTGHLGGIDRLDSLHRSVYDLIVKRFLAIFYPPAEYENVKLTLDVLNESFFTSAKVLVKPGYMEVTGIPQKKNTEGTEEDEPAPKEELIEYAKSLKIGDAVTVNEYKIKDGKTSPPKRYTSGNLILAMENAGNLIEDEELREQIKNTGIGTSATRGEILEKLVRIKYLNQNNKTQIITPEKLGEMIYEVVVLTVPTLLNPEMTASWEKGLEGIINGTVDDVLYREKLEDYIRRETGKMVNVDLTNQIALNINPFTDANSKGIATRKPLGLKCPDCGGELSTTAFGYGCSNYFTEGIECKFSIGKIAGVDISEEDFRTLITEGKTKVLDGFVSKSKKKFKAALLLKKNEENKSVVEFEFADVEAEYIEDLKCPNCGGRIVKTGFGYACEKRLDNDGLCRFSVGEIAGKSIDEEQLRKLLNEGTTDVISGFKSKSNKPFKAKLVLSKNEDGITDISFDFDGIEPDVLEGVVCPDCGASIQIKTVGFGCTSYNPENPDSCKFFVGKIAGKQLSAANVTELLKEGKTGTIRGFKSKSGKKFDACLTITKNESGKSQIGFDFENVEAKVIKDVKCPICGGEIVKTGFGYGCKNYDRTNPDNSCRFSIGTISGVKLNDSQIKALLTDGETPLISGFKSKTGNKFDAKIALSKDEEGRIVTKFVFEDNNKIIDGVTCPKCGAPVVKGRFGYNCQRNVRGSEEGCDFRVGIKGEILIEEEQLRKLINEKKTDVITGFVSKKGNVFDCALVLDENMNAVYEFTLNQEEENGTNN